MAATGGAARGGAGAGDDGSAAGASAGDHRSRRPDPRCARRRTGRAAAVDRPAARRRDGGPRGARPRATNPGWRSWSAPASPVCCRWGRDTRRASTSSSRRRSRLPSTNATPWPRPASSAHGVGRAARALPATGPNGPSRPASAWATITRCAWDCKPWPWSPSPRVSSTGRSPSPSGRSTVARRSDAAWANHVVARAVARHGPRRRRPPRRGRGGVAGRPVEGGAGRRPRPPSSLPLGHRRGAPRRRPLGRRPRRGPGRARPDRGERQPRRRRVRPRPLRPRRLPPRRSERGPVGGGRGPSQPRRRPPRDRLRVDDLDRRAAARDAGPTGQGPVDPRARRGI